MTAVASEDPDRDDDPEAALREARLRFVSQFPIQYTGCEQALERFLCGSADDRDTLTRTIHRIAGLAGMVGFPTVSVRARELEETLLQPVTNPLDAPATRRILVSLPEAFQEDMAAPAPVWAIEPRAAATGVRIVVVEDDPEQRLLVVTLLRKAGHRVFEVDRGDTAAGVIRAERPAIVLLDIDLPGASGLEVCRALKADADLHDTPVIFLTGRSSPAERVAGLTVGGDDYVIKPADAAELRLRIDRVLARRAVPPSAPLSGVMPYSEFLRVAVTLLDRRAAALALIRVHEETAAAVAAAVTSEMRRADFIGTYDASNIIALRPDASTEVAARQLTGVATSLAAQGMTIRVGVAGAAAGGEFRRLLQQADEALAEARVRGVPVVAYGQTPAAVTPQPAALPLVLIAEDDPDVMRVLDSRLQAAGYRTVLAFDGRQALEAIGAQAPDMVLLDLMLPRLTGFEVLTEMRRTAGRRPKVVVVSARGREDDVTRAFQLGADDYMTKPFGPEELLARLTRLLR